MGQEIVYCDGCRSRVSGQNVFRAGHQTFCADCAPKTPAPAPRRPPSDRGARRVPPAPPPSRPLALWITLALIALAIIVIIAVASRPSRP